jgi:hypothetical protein
MKQRDASLYVLIMIVLILGGIMFSHTPSRILSWDVFGYYLYLPFTFIYHDLGLQDFSVVEAIIEKYRSTATFYQAMPAASGTHWVMKYPMGMAVMYFPWFIIGHIWALFSSAEPDGFSQPYQLAVLYGSFVYTIIGLIYLRKSLLKFFSPQIVSILLVSIVFGTNYMIHSVYHGQGLMSHNYLFAVYALLLWFTIRWHEKPAFSSATGIALSIGLAALSRPTEVVVAAVPVLWGIADRNSLMQQLKLFWEKRQQLLLVMAIVGLFGSLQLIYYKVFAGKFLYNSYGGNAGEGLELLSPYIWQVLFSFRKGWLLYTPLMGLALIGFVFLFRFRKALFWSIFAYFLVSFYVIASWSCWWYADSFSQRPMLPMYVFLALPFGFLLQWICDQKRIARGFFALLLIALMALNQFQSWQFLKGMIHQSRMTETAFKAVFLKTKAPKDFQQLLLLDRNLSPEEILNSGWMFNWKQLATINMRESDRAVAVEGKPGPMVQLSIENPYSPYIEMPYQSMNVGEFALLRVKAKLYSPEGTTPGVQLTATFTHRGYPYAFNALQATGSQMDESGNIHLEMLYLTPEVRRPENLFRVIVELLDDSVVYVESISVEIGHPQSNVAEKPA